jgi:hypothetical protein
MNATKTSLFTSRWDRKQPTDDPLRLRTEKLHRLEDTHLARVGGGKPPYTSRQPSFR